jgi:hypothetical protein
MQNPDSTSHSAAPGRSVFARFAVPYSFNPDLRPREALFAVVGCLARIFGGVLLFAAWGGLSALALSAIGNRFWCAVAVLPLILLFLAALAFLMFTISAIENRVLPKREPSAQLDTLPAAPIE